MSYKLTNSNQFIIRGRDNALIPSDVSNVDYQEYLQWVSQGNTPQPADIVISAIPEVVTMRQARLALLQAGKLQLVQTAIDSLPSPQKEAALIEWDYSSEVHRNRAFVQMLSVAIGLNNEQMDQLFINASKL